jgi:ankyrin repeat protein
VNSVKRWVNCSNDSCTTNEQYRNPLLIYAARNRYVEVVRVLLEGGTNAERVDVTQRTALHYAAWYGYVEVCRLLLDWGAKVNPLDKWNFTPLHEAVRE